MNKLIRMMLAMVILALSSMAAHARTSPLFDPERVELKRVDGKPSTAEQVHQAILNGAKLDGGAWVWTVKSDQPGLVKLSYTRNGRFEALIQAAYDSKGYQLSYVSSVGLRYADKDGKERVIHRNYNKWIETLLRKIAIPGELEPVKIPSPKDKSDDGKDEGAES